MLSVTEIIGYLAALIGTFLMVPQVVKSVQTKSVNDVSIIMLVAYIVQCALWGIYGILLQAIPLVLCNAIAFCVGTFQGILKIKYSRIPTIIQ